MISLTLSLDDFIITQYLKAPQFETLSTYIQKMISKRPIPNEIRALTTVIFLFAVLVLIINTLLSNRNARINEKKLQNRRKEEN